MSLKLSFSLALLLAAVTSSGVVQDPPDLTTEDAEHLASLKSRDETVESTFATTWEIAVKETSERRIVRVLDEMDALDSLELASGHLLVFGRRSNTAVVAIIRLENMRHVDTIYCYQPTLSPSRQYLAYIRFYPPRGLAEYRTAVMLVYDLRSSPYSNRVGEVPRDRYRKWLGGRSKPIGLSLGTDVGHILYPEENRNQESYTLPVTDPSERRSIHELTWSHGSDALCFKEWKGDLHQQVTVSLVAGLNTVQITRGKIPPNN